MMLNLSNNIAFFGAMSFNCEATAKSVAEIRTSHYTKRNNTNLFMLVFYYVNSAHQNYGGLNEGALAHRVFVGGSSNLVQFATNQRLEPLGGDLVKSHKEAAIMATTPILITPVIHVENNHTFITSNELAQVFNKSHKNVIRDIEALECSEIFRGLNFELSFYDVITGNNAKRKHKCYHITKDGFSFLAMGFTGKKAAQFKEAYINAFNQMEAKLNNSHTELSTYSQDTDLLMTYLLSVREMTRSVDKLVALQSDVLPLLRPNIEFQSTHNLALANLVLSLDGIHSVSMQITSKLIREEVKAMEGLACQAK